MNFLEKDIFNTEAEKFRDILKMIPNSVGEKWKGHKPYVDIDYIISNGIIEKYLPHVKYPNKVYQYCLVDNSTDIFYVQMIMFVMSKNKHVMDDCKTMPHEVYQELIDNLLPIIKKSNPMSEEMSILNDSLWYGPYKYTPAHQSPMIMFADFVKENMPEIYQEYDVLSKILDMAMYVGWWSISNDGFVFLAKN